MTPEITESEPPPTDEQFAAIEAQIGASLPEDYRAFLTTTNGGRVWPEAFRYAGSSKGSLLDVIFSLGVGGAVRDLANEARTWSDRVPRDLLPIARDQGGNLVCLGVRGPRTGRIFMWSRQLAPSPRDPSSYENVWQIASSLAEFLDSFHE